MVVVYIDVNIIVVLFVIVDGVVIAVAVVVVVWFTLLMSWCSHLS